MVYPHRTTSIGLVIVLAGLLPGSVLADDKDQSKSLQPLRKGLEWEYEVSYSYGTPTRRATETVQDVVTVGDLPCYEVVSSSSEDRTYYVVNDDHLCLAGTLYSGKAAVSRPTQLEKLLRLTDQKVNFEFTFRSSAEPGSALMLARVEQAPDKITVLGKEHQAVRVTRHLMYESTKATINMVTSWYVPGIGLVREVFTSGSGPGANVKTLVAFRQAAGVTVGALKLDDRLDEREILTSVETIEATGGVVTEFEKSRTITREVTWSTKVGAGVEAEAKLGADLLAVKAELTARIKASVEQLGGEKLADSETRRQLVKIDGSVLPKAKIYWIDTYRTGTVEVTSDGKSYRVPFQFPVGTKLKIQKP